MDLLPVLQILARQRRPSNRRAKAMAFDPFSSRGAAPRASYCRKGPKRIEEAVAKLFGNGKERQ